MNNIVITSDSTTDLNKELIERYKVEILPLGVTLGDKSFIEDTEFFGWVYKQDGEKTVKTPYHEEVVVSEITWELDSPESNSIKIQNFKTQFEDLFQRITAST
jgi:hypothetical protein